MQHQFVNLNRRPRAWVRRGEWCGPARHVATMATARGCPHQSRRHHAISTTCACCDTVGVASLRGRSSRSQPTVACRWRPRTVSGPPRTRLSAGAIAALLVPPCGRFASLRCLPSPSSVSRPAWRRAAAARGPRRPMPRAATACTSRSTTATARSRRARAGVSRTSARRGAFRRRSLDELSPLGRAVGGRGDAGYDRGIRPSKNRSIMPSDSWRELSFPSARYHL